MTALSVTHESSVTEDQIDHLGHMNVRFYGTNARRGTRAVLAEVGLPDDGTVHLTDVYTRHHREQLLGARLAVRSGIVEADGSGLRIYHELVNSDDVLAATFFHRLTTDTPLSDAVVRAATGSIVAIPERAASRSIDLGADPLAESPSLDEVRYRQLEMREPRLVGRDECDAEGRYLPDNAPVLTWGGVPTGGGARGDRLHDGPNGEKMAWASMETRMIICRLPVLGEQIQAFGALVDLQDKTTHRIQWAYSLDHGDLLNSFETISLAFDTVNRRPMSIPRRVRDGERATLHPDLAPKACA